MVFLVFFNSLKRNLDLMCNSIFLLDTLTLKREDGNLVPVLNTGIAWPSDKQMKFRNPPNSQSNLSEGNNPFKAW